MTTTRTTPAKTTEPRFGIERSVLAFVIRWRDWSAKRAVLAELRESSFHDERHRALFRATAELVTACNFTVTELLTLLRRREDLDVCGGEDYVLELRSLPAERDVHVVRELARSLAPPV